VKLMRFGLFVAFVIAFFGATLPLWAATSPDVIYYLDSSGNVNELRFNGSSWSTTNVTQAASAIAANAKSRLTGHLYGSGDNVWYVGTDSHIHELSYYNSAWHKSDNTSLANAPDAEGNSPLTSVANYPNDYVVYVAADGDIHQLDFNGTSWSDSDLTTLSNAPVFSLAGPDSLGVSIASEQGNLNEAIYFKSVAGHLYTISNYVAYPYGCAGWCSTDLSGPGQFEPEDPAANTNIFSHIYESSQEVHYVGENGDLIQIAYYDFNGEFDWYGSDITSASGGPAPGNASTPLTGYQNSSYDDIYFMTSTPDVFMNWLNGSQWENTNVTSLSYGSAPDPSRAMTGEIWNTYPEVYCFLPNGDVYEYAFYSNYWHSLDVSSVVNAPAARSGSPIAAFTGGS